MFSLLFVCCAGNTNIVKTKLSESIIRVDTIENRKVEIPPEYKSLNLNPKLRILRKIELLQNNHAIWEARYVQGEHDIIDRQFEISPDGIFCVIIPKYNIYDMDIINLSEKTAIKGINPYSSVMKFIGWSSGSKYFDIETYQAVYRHPVNSKSYTIYYKKLLRVDPTSGKYSVLKKEVYNKANSADTKNNAAD